MIKQKLHKFCENCQNIKIITSTSTSQTARGKIMALTTITCEKYNLCERLACEYMKKMNER